MAGKTQRPGVKSSGWGGKRPGSGAKKISILSDKQAETLFRVIRKREKVEGRKWSEILMDFVYAKEGVNPIELSARDRLAAIKLLSDLVTVKNSEKSVTVTHNQGPAISLPQLDEDPALKVVGGGKLV